MKKLLCVFISAVLCLSMVMCTFSAEAQTDKSLSGYGYSGQMDLENLKDNVIDTPAGMNFFSNEMITHFDGPVVNNSGNSTIIIRDSFIAGNTTTDAVPSAGKNASLLVSGDTAAVINKDNGRGYLINSTIQAKNGAGILLSEAKAPGDGSKEMGFYLYGSKVKTSDGGYGVLCDLLGHLYLYGTSIQGSEVGIISGNFGKITIGDIEDGESCNELSAILTNADKDVKQDKDATSIIEGGRNALLINSKKLSEYEELGIHSAAVYAKDSILRTTIPLCADIAYSSQDTAYNKHSAGSVILVKSTETNIILDNCRVFPDENGTGYLVQTVVNNDKENMVAVPENKQYPGVNIVMENMVAAGDIAHEDYQRDFNLTLSMTQLTGQIDEYDCAHWNKVASDEGFADYTPESSYNTHHGMNVILKNASTWIVTEESVLTSLSVEDGCFVKGTIYLDGKQVDNVPGEYKGKVVVIPGDNITENEKEKETTTDNAAEKETEAHVHNWLRDNGGSPATCTEDGGKPYYCDGCGSTYTEILPAMGHDMVFLYGVEKSCLLSGYDIYECSRCGFQDEYNFQPAEGHEMSLVYETESSCTYQGQITYQCLHCTYIETSYKPFAEHNLVYDMYTPANCTSPSFYHYVCTNCTYDVWEVGEDPAYGHNYSKLTPDYAEGMQDTYHLLYCAYCGDLDFSSRAPHTGSPCECLWN